MKTRLLPGFFFPVRLTMRFPPTQTGTADPHGSPAE